MCFIHSYLVFEAAVPTTLNSVEVQQHRDYIWHLYDPRRNYTFDSLF